MPSHTTSKHKEVKMTMERVMETTTTLQGMENAQHPFKFAYAIARNIELLDQHVKAFRRAQQPSKEYQEYEKERFPLVQKHGKKGPQGNLISQPGQPGSVIIEDLELFNKEVEPLKEKYKEVIEAHEKKMQEAQEALQEEIDVHVYQFKARLLPKEISSRVLRMLLPMLLDPETLMEDDDDEIEEAIPAPQNVVPMKDTPNA